MKLALLSIVFMLLITSCQNSKKVAESALPRFKELDTFLLGQNCDRKDIINFAVKLQKTYDETRNEKIKTDEEYKKLIYDVCKNGSQTFKDVSFIEQKFSNTQEKDVYKIQSIYSASFMRDKKVLVKFEYEIGVKGKEIKLLKHNLSITDYK